MEPISFVSNAGSAHREGAAFLALILSVLLVGFMVSGCIGAPSDAAQKTGPPKMTADEPQSNMTAGEPQKTDAPADPSNTSTSPKPSTGGTPVVDKGAVAENKTGYDKINDTLQAVLADGVYPQIVSYSTPGGIEDVQFSLTIKDGKVSAVSATPIKADNISIWWINTVNDALPSLVVGKRIDSLNLPSQIAGSSLTTKAFADYMSGLGAYGPSTTPLIDPAGGVGMNTTPPKTDPLPPPSAPNAILADGVYPQTVSYSSPGGLDTVQFSLTLQNGVVSAVSAASVRADGTSMGYIDRFNRALPSLVVGKKIDSLNLPAQIAGSSLTTRAFAGYVHGLSPTLIPTPPPALPSNGSGEDENEGEDGNEMEDE